MGITTASHEGPRRGIHWLIFAVAMLHCGVFRFVHKLTHNNLLRRLLLREVVFHELPRQFLVALIRSLHTLIRLL